MATVLAPSLETAIGSSWFEISQRAANASFLTRLACLLPAEAAAKAVGTCHVGRTITARLHLHIAATAALHLDSATVDVDRVVAAVFDLDASAETILMRWLGSFFGGFGNRLIVMSVRFSRTC